MKFQGITTIDSEINFGECDIQEVPEEIKKLHPEHRLYCFAFYKFVDFRQKGEMMNEERVTY